MENIRFEIEYGQDQYWVTAWGQLYPGDDLMLLGYLHDDLSLRRKIVRHDKGGWEVSKGWFWTEDQCREKINAFMEAGEMIWEPLRLWERKSILYRDAGFMNYSEVINAQGEATN